LNIAQRSLSLDGGLREWIRHSGGRDLEEFDPAFALEVDPFVFVLDLEGRGVACLFHDAAEEDRDVGYVDFFEGWGGLDSEVRIFEWKEGIESL
jgi:hypothetical protein